MMRVSVRVEKSGRILIPAAVRRRLGLKEGESDLLLDIDDSGVQVTTRSQAVARVQGWASKYREPSRLVSADLSEERRREAELEFQE